MQKTLVSGIEKSDAILLSWVKKMVEDESSEVGCVKYNPRHSNETKMVRARNRMIDLQVEVV